ncbi:HAD-IA family hydrolase [Candidatus Pelagibacter sp. HIMB1710]|uniref:HAD-IA family hydrolase n=1 Tax=Candidatus Pelagibacter sp. HIMB1710 TaxID=3413368 RepID=UPI003F87519D
MKKNYKALLFGSIGTLVETSEIQRKSFNEAFKKNGLDWYWTKKEYIKLLNKSGGRDRITEYAIKKGIKVNAKQLRDLKTKLFNNYLKKNHLKLRPGVKNIINLCIKEKIKLAFVTSTSKNNINSILLSLRKSISQKNFNFIGNSKLVKNLKPNPDIYLLALKKLKLKPNQCLAIEDSQESLNSAVNAKIKCIIFPGKFHLNKKFKNAFKKLEKLNKNIILK